MLSRQPTSDAKGRGAIAGQVGVAGRQQISRLQNGNGR
jgi:hypothetical protein